MVLLVLIFPAHPTHITTVLSVDVQTQEITANLGNTTKELDLFINLVLARRNNLQRHLLCPINNFTVGFYSLGSTCAPGP